MVRGYTSIEPSVKTLKWVGGLPPKRGYIKLYLVYGTFLQLFCGFGFIIPQIMYCVKNFQDLNSVIDNFYAIIEVSSAVWKSSLILIYHKSFVKTREILDCDRFKNLSSAQERVMLNCMTIIKRFALAYHFGCWTCCITAYVIPIFAKGRAMPFPGWYIIDSEKTPAYQIFYLWQCVAITVMSSLQCTIDLLMSGILSLACAQFDVLRDSFQNLYEKSLQIYIKDQPNAKYDPEKFDKIITKEITECVHHHRKILELLDSFQETYNWPMFGQFFGSTLVLSFSMYKLSVSDFSEANDFNVFIFISFMFSQIFLYCYYGDKIFSKSTEVVGSIWMSEWDKCSPKVRKLLIYMMERSRVPAQIRAGYFLEVSLTTYQKIVKLSYSVFTLFNTMKKE